MIHVENHASVLEAGSMEGEGVSLKMGYGVLWEGSLGRFSVGGVSTQKPLVLKFLCGKIIL